MIFNYCDEEERLSASVRTTMERACEVAFSDETGIMDAPCEVSITIVDADEIREINNEFRGIDRSTDVLSFPQYNDADEIADEIRELEGEDYIIPIGDVVICYDQALKQADEYGTGADRELVYLFVHSIFHLLGYDHMEEDDKREMRAREEFVMNEIGLPEGGAEHISL